MKRVLILLLLASPAFADVVHLKSGGKIEGRVTDLGDKISIETGRGTITISKAQVVRIEKKKWDPPKPEKKEEEKPDKKPLLRNKLTAAYANAFLSFKIYLPEGWARGQRHGKASCTFWGPRDVAYLPRLDLFVERRKSELADVVADFKNSFKKMAEDVLFEEEGATTIGNRNAYQFLAKFRQGEIVMNALWTFVVADGRQYILSYTCTEAWFPRYHELIDASMRSIRVFAEVELTAGQRAKYGTHHTKGQTAYGEKKFPEAAAHFQHAIDILPKWPETYSYLGMCHMRLKQYEKARDAFLKARELDPADFGHNYKLGVSLLALDKPSAASKALEKAVKIDPKSEPAHTNLGAALIQIHEYDEAVEILETAATLDPESVSAQYNLGVAYENTDRKKEAIRQYRNALKLDPKHAGAKERLANLKK